MEGLRAGGYLGRESQSGNDDGQSVTGSPFSVFLRGGVRGYSSAIVASRRGLGLPAEPFCSFGEKPEAARWSCDLLLRTSETQGASGSSRFTSLMRCWSHYPSEQ